MKAKFAGQTRRKKKVVHSSGANDEKKLSGYFKRIGAQPVPGIEEINLFHADGNVTHFANPRLQAALGANTFIVNGHSETKPLQHFLPKIISQLGVDNMAALQKIMAQQPTTQDEDVPDLIGNTNFEEVSKA